MEIKGDGSSFIPGETQEMDLLVNQVSKPSTRVMDNLGGPVYMNAPYKNNFSFFSDSSITFSRQNEPMGLFRYSPSNGNNFIFMPTTTLSPNFCLNRSPPPNPILPHSFDIVNPFLKSNPIGSQSILSKPSPSSFGHHASFLFPFLNMRYRPSMYPFNNNAPRTTSHPHIDLNEYPPIERVGMIVREPQRYFTCKICGLELPTYQAFGGHMSYHSKKVKAQHIGGESSRPQKKTKN